MRTDLPDPVSAPQLFDELLTRRSIAFLIDWIILGVISAVLSVAGFIAGFLTLGLAWASLFVVIPLAFLGYYGVTLGSPRHATLGMQMMDLVLVPTRGQTMNGGLAILHALVFWITVWISWPISVAFALFTPRRQMINDLIVGTLMLRRSPMAQQWDGQTASV